MIGALLTRLLATYGLHAALVFGIGAAALTWDRSRIQKGVKQEQVRVEKQGEKIDARAQTARRAAEQRPADSLRGYYRD